MLRYHPKLINLIPVVFILFGFLFLYSGAHTAQSLQQETDAELKHISDINRTYLTVNTCMFSVPYDVRTAAYIRHCYDVAESITGQHIQRFGDAK